MGMMARVKLPIATPIKPAQIRLSPNEDQYTSIRPFIVSRKFLGSLSLSSKKAREEDDKFRSRRIFPVPKLIQFRYFDFLPLEIQREIETFDLQNYIKINYLVYVDDMCKAQSNSLNRLILIQLISVENFFNFDFIVFIVVSLNYRYSSQYLPLRSSIG